MSTRILLLVAGFSMCWPSLAVAQLGTAVAGESLAMPNTEVHHLTAANGRAYSLYVNLPESYADSDSTTYPVLYLTDAEAEVVGMYLGTNYFLRLTRRIRDVILVGVADGGIREHQGLRGLDYTPTPQPVESTTTGGAGEFLAFLRDRAIPLIQDRYRADPADRGLWGYSFGGALAAHALLNEPSMFHRYLLTSPSLHWDDRLLVRQAAVRSGARAGLPARVYTAFGADERPTSVEAWEAFVAELRSPRYPDLTVSAELVPNADHTTVMPIAFMRGMVAIYGQRPIATTMDSAIVAAGIHEAVRLYHRLRATERREHDFAEPHLNRLGYRLLRADRIDEAIVILRLNAEQYSGSWNAHDSLGEAYMVAGDRDRAIDSYRRSLELNPGSTSAVEMLRKLGVDPT